MYFCGNTLSPGALLGNYTHDNPHFCLPDKSGDFAVYRGKIANNREEIESFRLCGREFELIAFIVSIKIIGIHELGYINLLTQNTLKYIIKSEFI